MQKTVQMAVQIVYLLTKPIIALAKGYAICILWMNLCLNGNIIRGITNMKKNNKHDTFIKYVQV